MGKASYTIIIYSLFGAATLLLHSGCSTIINASRHRGVLVKSEPPGAEMFADNAFLGKTPAPIDLLGNSGQCRITIKKDGEEGEVKVTKRMDPWVWGNAILAVFPPVAAAGFAIDAYGGKWYRYEPSVVSMTFPSKETPVLPPSGDVEASSDGPVNDASPIGKDNTAGGSRGNDDDMNLVHPNYPDPVDEYLKQ